MPPTMRLKRRRFGTVLAFASTVLILRAAWAQDNGRYGGGGASDSDAQFQGSVTGAREPAGVVDLSLRQATDLGLANNLGLLLNIDKVTSARGERWVELSRLLPDLSVAGSFHRLRESLAPTGITLPGVPPVVGPFNYYDARVFLRQRVFDLESIKRTEAAGHDVAAARFSEQNARELVIIAVGAAYLQVLTGIARVETVEAQVATARTILDRAVEMHQAGVTPGIDELRARVEFLARTQELIVAQNDLAKDRLSLNRLIGLPVGQEVVLTDSDPFEPPPAGGASELLARALVFREELRAAKSLLEAAEASHRAAQAQRIPSLFLDADYGMIGLTPSSLHGSYHIVGSLRFPIFEGGKIHGDVLRAEALVRQRREEFDDLRGRIEFEVRTALLDVEAAGREVGVAGETVRLAETALAQAQERFSAGIDDNLEVVQAQQAVAVAHEALVSSRYRFNLAKLTLSRATGTARWQDAGGR